MKRAASLAIAALIGLIIAQPVHAQWIKQWSAGIRGGLNLADIEFPAVDFDASLGFAAGAFAGYRFHEQWGVQAIVSYSQKGAKDSGESSVGAFTRTIEIPYVELQVPVVLTPALRNENLVPRIYIGPYVAYELSCNVTLEDPTGTTKETCEEGAQSGISPETKSIDYGVVIGIGLNFMRGRGGISIDVVYDLGLANINNIPAAPEVKNRVFQFLIGYVHIL